MYCEHCDKYSERVVQNTLLTHHIIQDIQRTTSEMRILSFCNNAWRYLTTFEF